MRKILLSAVLSISIFGYGGMDALNMPASARIMGLGGAYTAVFGGINSALSNPAGLSGEKAVMSTYMNAMGLNYVSLGKSQPLNETSTIAYGFRGTFSPPMVRTGETGESLGIYRYIDLLPYFSYENGLPEKFTYGITGKIYYRNATSYNSAGLGIDAGMLYKIMGSEEDNLLHSDNNMLWLGACLKNLGYIVKPFDQTREIFPVEIKVGLSYVMKNSVLVFDYTPLKDISLGYETSIGEFLSLRGGFTTRYNDMKIGDQSDIVNGLSFGFTTRAKNITVDYATVFTSLTSPLQIIEIHF